MERTPTVYEVLDALENLRSLATFCSQGEFAFKMAWSAAKQGEEWALSLFRAALVAGWNLSLFVPRRNPPIHGWGIEDRLLALRDGHWGLRAIAYADQRAVVTSAFDLFWPEPLGDEEGPDDEGTPALIDEMGPKAIMESVDFFSFLINKSFGQFYERQVFFLERWLRMELYCVSEGERARDSVPTVKAAPPADSPAPPANNDDAGLSDPPPRGRRKRNAHARSRILDVLSKAASGEDLDNEEIAKRAKCSVRSVQGVLKDLNELRLKRAAAVGANAEADE